MVWAVGRQGWEGLTCATSVPCHSLTACLALTTPSASGPLSADGGKPLHPQPGPRRQEAEGPMAGVLTRKDDDRKRESQKPATHKEKRRLAIRNAAQQWEEHKACLEVQVQNGPKEEASPEHGPALPVGLTPQLSPDELRIGSPVGISEKPAGGSENRLRTSRPSSPRDPRSPEAGGASLQSLSLSDCHLAELDGDTLRLVGPGALEALERGWGAQTASTVAVVSFRYIPFDTVVPTLPRVRTKFPNLSHLIFLETNIRRLSQLAALAQVRRLDQLTVHPNGNPVVSLTLWRSFVIYRLNHFNLQKINGQEVSLDDVLAAERLFGALGHIAATEVPHCRLLLLLEESRKRQLQFLLELRENGGLLGEGLSRALLNYPNYPSRDTTDSAEEGTIETPERDAEVQLYLRGLVRRASDTHAKGESLQKLWPSLFMEMVRDCVLDMRDRVGYRQASLDRLSHSL